MSCLDPEIVKKAVSFISVMVGMESTYFFYYHTDQMQYASEYTPEFVGTSKFNLLNAFLNNLFEFSAFIALQIFAGAFYFLLMISALLYFIGLKKVIKIVFKLLK